jgi:hypothetical protein
MWFDFRHVPATQLVNQANQAAKITDFAPDFSAFSMGSHPPRTGVFRIDDHWSLNVFKLVGG